jgi:hypothetical protein
VHTEAQPTQGLFPPSATPAERRQIARNHAALFPATLALARWQHGGHLPHRHCGEPGLRAAWFAEARRDFQAWLERGGFSQYDDEAGSGSDSPLLDGDTQPADAC